MLLSTYINFTRILGSQFSQSIVTSKYCYQQRLLLTKKQCTWNLALLCWGTSAQEPTHPPIGDRCCSHMTSLTPSLCWLSAQLRHFISVPKLCSFYINSFSLWPSCRMGVNKLTGLFTSMLSALCGTFYPQDWLLLVWTKWLFGGQGVDWKEMPKGHWMSQVPPLISGCLQNSHPSAS